jgi:hypothetical protein
LAPLRRPTERTCPLVGRCPPCCNSRGKHSQQRQGKAGKGRQGARQGKGREEGKERERESERGWCGGEARGGATGARLLDSTPRKGAWLTPRACSTPGRGGREGRGKEDKDSTIGGNADNCTGDRDGAESVLTGCPSPLGTALASGIVSDPSCASFRSLFSTLSPCCRHVWTRWRPRWRQASAP